MSVTPIESLADAIMTFEGWKAGSRSNRNRNPGNLRSGVHEIGHDLDGYSIFEGLEMGYASLLYDVIHKITGRTHTGLGPDSTLLHFFEVYSPSADHNHPAEYADYVAAWMSHALAKPITRGMLLSQIFPDEVKDAWNPQQASFPKI